MSNQPYQMSFLSDGTVHHEGPGQPSPMLGIIAQAMTKMLAKKKAREEEKAGEGGAGMGEIDDGAGESDESEAMPFSTDPVTLPDENGEPETWFFVHTDPEGNPLPDQSGEHVSGGASSSNGGGLVDGSVTIGDAKKKGKGKHTKKKNKKGGKK